MIAFTAEGVRLRVALGPGRLNILSEATHKTRTVELGSKPMPSLTPEPSVWTEKEGLCPLPLSHGGFVTVIQSGGNDTCDFRNQGITDLRWVGGVPPCSPNVPLQALGCHTEPQWRVTPARTPHMRAEKPSWEGGSPTPGAPAQLPGSLPDI